MCAMDMCEFFTIFEEPLAPVTFLAARSASRHSEDVENAQESVNRTTHWAVAAKTRGKIIIIMFFHCIWYVFTAEQNTIEQK